MLFPLYFNIYFILTHHLYILSASITLQCQPTPNFHNKNPKKGPNPPSSPLKSSIISLPHFPPWISHLSCICECLRNFVASIFIEPGKQTNKQIGCIIFQYSFFWPTIPSHHEINLQVIILYLFVKLINVA